MKQLKGNVVCCYCYGCNRLLLEDFNGVKFCKNMVPTYKNWQEEYYKALKEEKGNGM